MTHGGRRIGAGKPKGYKAPHTITAEASKARLIEMASLAIEPIARALIAKAEQGDVPAIKELFDRAWGKSKESVDMNVQPVFSLRALAEQTDALEKTGFRI